MNTFMFIYHSSIILNITNRIILSKTVKVCYKQSALPQQWLCVAALWKQG